MKKIGLHWFRRDLRVAGNPALIYNFKNSEGNTLGLFCFDRKFLSRPDMSFDRFQFFLNTLSQLRNELRELGGDLLVLDEGPDSALSALIDGFKQSEKYHLDLVTWNRDYEPFARERDQRIKDLLSEQSIENKNFRDHLLLEPWEVLKDSSDPQSMYQVFTPYSRKWLEAFKTEGVQKRLQRQVNGLSYLEKRLKGEKLKKIFNVQWKDLDLNFSKKDQLEECLAGNLEKVSYDIPKGGSLEAYQKLKEFEEAIDQYGESRDIPHLEATSDFSMFLKNGSLTIPQIIQYYDLKPYKKPETSRDKFFSELIWREFYYGILYHNPRVEQEEFQLKYKGLSWDNNEEWFEAWKEGKTGFPIVDAGMRQLKTTGKMHNRVRMIVASFLTKDLLIDWRWGEKYFMHKLLDGDLAANNGGWQWAASTGCDAQPYFRIFNPWSQSKKFDSEGHYIKRYLPELEDYPSKKLHEPILDHEKYPQPIVDHKAQREKALEMYKSKRD